jgi:hypothetical protein
MGTVPFGHLPLLCHVWDNLKFFLEVYFLLECCDSLKNVGIFCTNGSLNKKIKKLNSMRRMRENIITTTTSNKERGGNNNAPEFCGFLRPDDQKQVVCKCQRNQ